MATPAAAPAPPQPIPLGPGPSILSLPGSVWMAPLVPIAVATTAGIVLDRHFSIPLAASLLAALAGLIGWASLRQAGASGPGLILLWLSAAALGAAYHRWHRDAAGADDIRRVATSEARVARLRGHIVSDPTLVRGQPSGSLRALPS